jgi:hypothetical protein
MKITALKAQLADAKQQLPFDEFGEGVDDLTAMREVGCLGEAAVFKDLRDSGLYRTVEWTSRSDADNGRRIVSGDEEFYVREESQPYDIRLITSDDKKVLVEVKSTVRQINDGRVAHHFGEPQLRLFEQSPRRHQSVLALVFRARDPRPDIHYFSIGQFQ